MVLLEGNEDMALVDILQDMWYQGSREDMLLDIQ